MKKKKILKIIALVAALAILGTLGYFANALLGNPISKAMAERTVAEHLATEYAGTDFYCVKLGYSFKNCDYYAHIRSSSSIDTQFTLYVNLWGELVLDTYDDVLRGSITARRLDSEYRELTDAVFNDPSFPYAADIGYCTLVINPQEALDDPNVTDVPEFTLIQQDLILDHNYDVRELGAQAGEINIYVDSETITPELAAEMMLEIRACFDAAGVPFRVMDFTLQLPLPEEGPREEVYILVTDFPYEDIYEEGMVDRVIAEDADTKAYYAAQDAENDK